MNKKKMKQVVFEIMGVLISFLVLIPFLMVFLNSMKSKRQANLLQLSLTAQQTTYSPVRLHEPSHP